MGRLQLGFSMEMNVRRFQQFPFGIIFSKFKPVASVPEVDSQY
jgi:hypothetical protein